MSGSRRRPTAGLDDLELRAWRGLIETTAQLRYHLDRMLAADSGLSGSDYPVLVTLHECERPHLRASDLADRVGWERSRLSHHLARMERRGLIRRSADRTDNRGSNVALTDAGRRAYLAATVAHSAAVREQFVDALDRRQLEQLGDIMAALERHLAR